MVEIVFAIWIWRGNNDPRQLCTGKLSELFERKPPFFVKMPIKEASSHHDKPVHIISLFTISPFEKHLFSTIRVSEMVNPECGAHGHLSFGSAPLANAGGFKFC